jgi:hypothetical protein
MADDALATLLHGLEMRFWDGSPSSEINWERTMVEKALHAPRLSFSRLDVERIAKWKNREALSVIVERQVRKNSPKVVREVTAEAFAETDPARAIETLASIRKLHGVGYPVASAILTFHNPRKYTVLDVNAWRALHYLGRMDTDKAPYYDGHVYADYLSKCLTLSRQWGLGLRETDRILWALGAWL